MKFLRFYVRTVDGMNRGIGIVVMFGLFGMMSVLLWSTVSKAFDAPALWTLETAQFCMVAYYMIGGAYSIQLGSNVRMDLLYAEWTDRRKAQVDAMTVFFLIFYLGVLLYGGLSSLAYSLGHFQGGFFGFFSELGGAFLTGGPAAAVEVTGHLERSPSVWRPVMWPVKLIMVTGIFLMLLQALSELAKDVLKIREGTA